MGKAIELKEGMRFGRQTILNKDPEKHPDRYVYQICKCDCGTIKAVKGSNLKKGSSLSCGCLRNDLTSKNKTIDLTGQKFGHLTVLKKYEEKDKKTTAAYQECQCDCGNPNIKIVRGTHLRLGEVTSCGICVNLNKDLPKEHDYLQLLDYDFIAKKYNIKCKNCGAIVKMTSDNYKKAKSCGCIKSFGEQLISDILNKNNIPFIKEATFKNCISTTYNRPYRFDFYVNNQYIIEYDGEQHFKIGNGVYNNSEKFKITQLHDEYKNQWCKENNIPLIRIPYTHLKDLCIEDLLLETSNFILQ